jgi:hypothetical protein
MSRIAIVFGILLTLLGVGGYFGSGGASKTALIPCVFGVLLILFGAVALKEKFRMHAMHGAALVGVLGFLGAARGFAGVPALLSGEAERPVAILSQVAMALLCLVFVGLCVKSFIDARRSREAAAQPEI